MEEHSALKGRYFAALIQHPIADARDLVIHTSLGSVPVTCCQAAVSECADFKAIECDANVTELSM